MSIKLRIIGHDLKPTTEPNPVSTTWGQRINDVGKVAFKLPLKARSVSYLTGSKVEILLDNHHTFTGFIYNKSIDEKNETISYSGTDYMGWLAQRIIWYNVISKTEGSLVLRDILTRYFKDVAANDLINIDNVEPTSTEARWIWDGKTIAQAVQDLANSCKLSTDTIRGDIYGYGFWLDQSLNAFFKPLGHSLLQLSDVLQAENFSIDASDVKNKVVYYGQRGIYFPPNRDAITENSKDVWSNAGGHADVQPNITDAKRSRMQMFSIRCERSGINDDGLVGFATYAFATDANDSKNLSPFDGIRFSFYIDSMSSNVAAFDFHLRDTEGDGIYLELEGYSHDTWHDLEKDYDDSDWMTSGTFDPALSKDMYFRFRIQGTAAWDYDVYFDGINFYRDEMKATVKDDDSIKKYQLREITLVDNRLRDYETTLAYANGYLAMLKLPKIRATITYAGFIPNPLAKTVEFPVYGKTFESVIRGYTCNVVGNKVTTMLEIGSEPISWQNLSKKIGRKLRMLDQNYVWFSKRIHQSGEATNLDGDTLGCGFVTCMDTCKDVCQDVANQSSCAETSMQPASNPAVQTPEWWKECIRRNA